MTTIADRIVTDMIIHGDITHVFGVVGGAIEPLMNAIARAQKQGTLQFVSARHETDAVYMAEGFFRATRKMAAVVATSGPGSTNLITGLASALENRIPILVLTGLPAQASWGNGALQESVHERGYLHALRAVTKESLILSHIGQLTQYEELLYLTAHAAPRGPVHLALPLNIQKEACTDKTPLTSTLYRHEEKLATKNLDILMNIIATANTIVLVIGADAEAGIEYIEQLAAVLHADILVTPDAKGLVRTNALGYAGVFGFGGQPSAFATLAAQPDLILAIGVRIGEFSTASWHTNLLNGRLIFVHNDLTMLARATMARVRYEIAPMLFMMQLIYMLHAQPLRNTPVAHLTAERPTLPLFTSTRPVHPAHLMQWLATYMTANSFLFADAGNAMTWSPYYLTHDMQHPTHRSWYAVMTDFAGMGFAIGASVGAAFAQMHDHIICLTGDGSMLMNGQELSVAREHTLPILFVILNDASFGMVRHGQILGQAESIGWNIPEVDFKKFANALGVPALQIRTNRALARISPATLPPKGPYLLDVHIDRDAVPPMKQRVATLTA